MANRWVKLTLLILFVLTVPTGLFFFLTSSGMGFPKSQAGIVAGILAFAAVALAPMVLKQKPSAVSGDALPAKSAWIVLVGFLIAMVAVLAYFAMRDQ